MPHTTLGIQVPPDGTHCAAASILQYQATKLLKTIMPELISLEEGMPELRVVPED